MKDTGYGAKEGNKLVRSKDIIFEEETLRPSNHVEIPIDAANPMEPMLFDLSVLVTSAELPSSLKANIELLPVNLDEEPMEPDYNYEFDPEENIEVQIPEDQLMILSYQ